MYRNGWIDFNRNGEMDPYEDPALDIDSRIEDLLGRMSMEEKTGQLTTLYGYPNVLRDSLPTPEWQGAYGQLGRPVLQCHTGSLDPWKIRRGSTCRHRIRGLQPGGKAYGDLSQIRGTDPDVFPCITECTGK